MLQFSQIYLLFILFLDLHTELYVCACVIYTQRRCILKVPILKLWHGSLQPSCRRTVCAAAVMKKIFMPCCRDSEATIHIFQIDSTKLIKSSSSTKRFGRTFTALTEFLLVFQKQQLCKNKVSLNRFDSSWKTHKKKSYFYKLGAQIASVLLD